MGYTGTLTAIHGTLPYMWSISTGALPSGLTLDAASGVVTGKPTALGLFNFTVQVRDAGSPMQTATKPLSISIVAGNDHFVDISNRTPSWPYASWVNAATNIQDAIDASMPAIRCG